MGTLKKVGVNLKPKYKQIKSWLLKKIENGEFIPHQKIYSETELMQRFCVSRHTARLAISELVNEGWLYKEQGAGTFFDIRQKKEYQTYTKNPTNNIAIVTTYISDYIFPSIIAGAESVFRKNGYDVTLFSTNNNQDIEREVLEKIINGNYAGAIIEPTQSASPHTNIPYYLELKLNNFPFVMINAYYDKLEPNYLVMDDEQTSYELTELLIQNGHQRIVGFFKIDDLQGVLRIKGFYKALKKNKITIKSDSIITFTTGEKNSKPAESFERLLAQTENKPTAAVLYNDELAMCLLHIIRKHQLKIPEDFSFVSFDNSFLAEITEVKLTSASHPKQEMGIKAAEMVIHLLKSKTETSTLKTDSVIYSPEIVQRNSIADKRGVKI